MSPKKFNDGEAADPFPRVSELMKLVVAVWALYTFVPSQIAMMVWFWGRVIVVPPITPVLNVSVYEPVVEFLREYN